MYEYCVKSFVFDFEFDVLIVIIWLMLYFIDKLVVNGWWIYVVVNEIMVGENFVECWNIELVCVVVFYEWYVKVLVDFEVFLDL